MDTLGGFKTESELRVHCLGLARADRYENNERNIYTTDHLRFSAAQKYYDFIVSGKLPEPMQASADSEVS